MHRSLDCTRLQRRRQCGGHGLRCAQYSMQHSSSTNPTCTKASWKPRGNHHAIPTSQLTPMQKKVSRSTIAAARLHPQFGLKLPPLLLKSGLLHTHTREATLKYLINELACLTISPLFSTQLALIGSCSLYSF